MFDPVTQCATVDDLQAAMAQNPEDPDATKISGRGSPTVDVKTAHPSASREIEIGPGSIIKDRFVIESVIGRGGMGVVYRARDRRKEETQDRDPYVAIKVLSDQFRRDQRMVIALQREARKAQTLAHPNITTVYDFDRDGSLVFISMEVLEGEPLDEVIATHPKGLPRTRALRIIRGLCLGLAYAHNKNIVHSDFKPGNVFLTDDNRVKILDFGIARAAPAGAFDEDSPAATPAAASASAHTQFDAGELGALTPSYASCEMFARAEPHPADDVFALAVVAYQLLCGAHPFDFMPAPQAREAGLEPAPIKGLKRREWRALLRGLSFDRASRSPHAARFLRDLEGSPQLRLTAAIGVTLALATAGYAAYDRFEAARAAAPDIAFVDLPAQTQLQLTQWLEDGDQFLKYGDAASALDQFVRAYQVHPRDPEAVKRIEALFEAMLAATAVGVQREDLITLKENLDSVLGLDEFMGRRPELTAASALLDHRISESN